MSDMPAARTGRRAAVLGSPVSHSLSPLLHRAAYAALGLDGWRYDAVECDAAALPGLVDGLGPEWVGLSVTMPGKRAALARADERTERAVAVGAANTLVRQDGGWLADCTDVDGVSGALVAAGWSGPRTGEAVVLGAGATAAAAIAALAGLGVEYVTLLVRTSGRAGDAVACARRVGVRVKVDQLDPGAEMVGMDSLEGMDRFFAATDVVVSTLPAGVVDAPLAAAVAAAPFVLDVVYHPWPTPLAAAVAARGGQLATGLDMLLHQAFGQVELFTGQPAPRDAMRAALPDLAAG